MTAGILVLLFSAPALAQRITLTAPIPTAPPNVTITITLSGSVGVAGLQWFLPALPGMVATAGPAAVAAGKTLTCAEWNGRYGCLLAGINARILTDGVLATLTLPTPKVATSFALTSMLGASLAGDAIAVGSGALLRLPPPFVTRRRDPR